MTWPPGAARAEARAAGGRVGRGRGGIALARRHLPRGVVLTAVGALAASAATAATLPLDRRIVRGRCTGLTSLRTLAVTRRRTTDFHVRPTTIAALAARERPGRIVHGSSSFERQTFEVVAQIVLARRTLNNAVQLVLYYDGAYLNAVLPPLQCLSARTPGRERIAAARYRYVGSCGIPSLDWEPLGAVAYVSGVGYWSSRFRRGAARNGAALAPVTGIRLLAGCGAR